MVVVAVAADSCGGGWMVVLLLSARGVVEKGADLSVKMKNGRCVEWSGYHTALLGKNHCMRAPVTAACANVIMRSAT